MQNLPSKPTASDFPAEQTAILNVLRGMPQGSLTFAELNNYSKPFGGPKELVVALARKELIRIVLYQRQVFPLDRADIFKIAVKEGGILPFLTDKSTEDLPITSEMVHLLVSEGHGSLIPGLYKQGRITTQPDKVIDLLLKYGQAGVVLKHPELFNLTKEEVENRLGLLN